MRSKIPSLNSSDVDIFLKIMQCLSIAETGNLKLNVLNSWHNIRMSFGLDFKKYLKHSHIKLKKFSDFALR